MLQVTNDRNRKFNIRLVKSGDRYGLNDCLVHDKPDDPMVEFYDASYPQFGERGQFVSRYYLRTLMEGSQDSELCLQGDVPEWHVSAKNKTEAIQYALKLYNFWSIL